MPRGKRSLSLLAPHPLEGKEPEPILPHPPLPSQGSLLLSVYPFRSWSTPFHLSFLLFPIPPHTSSLPLARYPPSFLLYVLLAYFRIFKDIAVLTNDISRCEMYQSESENVKGRWACELSKEYLKRLNWRNYRIPNNKEECEVRNKL